MPAQPVYSLPPLSHGDVTVRMVRQRDAKPLEDLRQRNLDWLEPWEATLPGLIVAANMRASVRALIVNARAGTGLPWVMEYQGELVGQMNVSSISFGSLCGASVGYWIAESAAGHNVTPISLALVTDFCFGSYGLHRVEICIRPENRPSHRVVEKLGFRYEGLRRKYLHIAGDWRDHDTFALVADEVPEGVLGRYLRGLVPANS